MNVRTPTPRDALRPRPPRRDLAFVLAALGALVLALASCARQPAKRKPPTVVARMRGASRLQR